jgi:hypothetical protein
VEIEMRVIYDVETYKDAFIFCTPEHVFEISIRKNQSKELRSYLDDLIDQNDEMVGFNNVYFDYPIIHYFYDHYQTVTSEKLYELGQDIINDKFKHVIWSNNRYIKQIDLFLINHFDNMAKRTSLKNLEFVLHMHNVQELPYEPSQTLTHSQIDEIIHYCKNDVKATSLLYKACIPVIEFRNDLSLKYGIDFTNHNDVKIGKDIFVSILEQQCPGICYDYSSGRKTVRQTPRPDGIDLNEIIFPYISFINQESVVFLKKLKMKKIYETKGVFKDLNLNCYNIPLIFGTGGIHGSVEDTAVHENENYKIIDADVSSFYPNISIQNNLYPEHLSELFVEEYKNIYEQRKKFSKGSLENAAYKLALNGTYGNSNSKFSPFYDPAFTMSITINGQLLLAMLIDMLAPRIKIIQANTDGVTAYVHKDDEDFFHSICEEWMRITKLELEYTEYSSMYVKNVNNYLAIKKDGKVKRKGIFEYNKAFHQDHSALIVPKAVEQFLLNGTPISQTIYLHDDCFDFLIRARCNRDSFLSMNKNEKIGRQLRYYASVEGDYLYKCSPPLKGKDKERWFAIDKNVKVSKCNNIFDFNSNNLNYDYYIKVAKEMATFNINF